MGTAFPLHYITVPTLLPLFIFYSSGLPGFHSLPSPYFPSAYLLFFLSYLPNYFSPSLLPDAPQTPKSNPNGLRLRCSPPILV